ncbi:hypothetical protein [Jatrophihabitans sp.]|uniref:hypothetical protein n=1 Tax=Jatrophihabitans sp. TaxID=1932789 RepID=UPI0030C6E537|nr:hypothetical protein [Jatrophihabitans sp.]
MTTTDIDPIAQAKQEAADAAELAQTLEDRIREGDESVTPEELANAESLGKFARLRVEAAERKVASELADAALARGRKLAKDLEAVESEDATLVEAWLDAVKTMRALGEAVAARKARIGEHIGEIQQVEAQLHAHAGVGLDAVGILGAKYANHYGFQVPAAGIDVLEVPTGLVLASVAHEGLDENTRREMAGKINSREPDLAGSVPGQSVEGWADAIRGLRA